MADADATLLADVGAGKVVAIEDTDGQVPAEGDVEDHSGRPKDEL